MVGDKPMTPLPATLLREASGALLVVAPTEEIAKRIESFLRNAGHPLHAAWINDLEDLEDVLKRDPPDLVLCDQGLEHAPPERVLTLCAQLRPDLPVIVIGAEHSPDDSTRALAAGAQDYAAYGDAATLRHLELVVVREFVKHHSLRMLRLTQQRLADFESRHQQLTAGTADAVAHVQEGILAQANAAFARLLGYDDPAELAGQPVIDLVAPPQRDKVKERLRAVLKGKHNGEPLELELAGKQGRIGVSAQLILGSQDGERVIEFLIRSGGGRGEPGPTRGAFQARDAFADALAAPPPDAKTARTALLLKIDAFEQLENRIGYVEAQQVATLLAESVRTKLAPQDLAFAFSTDELALLIERGDYDATEQWAESLHKEIAHQVFATRGHEAQITATLALYPLGGQDSPAQVIRGLAQEVRKASVKGGNRLVALGAQAKANLAEREDARRAAAVRKAIEENRLKLAYQSIASLEGEARSYFDVLVRLLDETGKEWYASEFLPAAQKFGLMRAIDRWVTARAFAVIAKRAASKQAAVLFVKLSEDTLKDGEAFVAWLKPLLAAQPLKNDELVFELQEPSLQNHVRKAKALTQALRECGAGIAVEHYGLSVNSAQLLDHIPAQFVKFHPSFTQNFSDKEVQKKLGDLVENAKQHGRKTIVSHVEDANVMARLWQMGVNFIQGFHVQEPEVVLIASDMGQRG
ncbi:MAG: EAL domain-containing protein [Sinobacteraceae bacterium]|nr:EAL domain-containing protein [Nevskiaceae bacterium]